MRIENTDNEITVRTLLEKCKESDETAFKRIVETHNYFVFRVAFKILLDETEAREAAHECFVRVWKNIKYYNAEIKFTTWLYKIVVNICYDKIRMMKRRRSVLSYADGDISDNSYDPGIEEEIGNKELVDLILKYSVRLPEKQRMVFALRDLGGLSVKEVSAVLKISEGSVKTNLFYARREIAEKLKKLQKEND